MKRYFVITALLLLTGIISYSNNFSVNPAAEYDGRVPQKDTTAERMLLYQRENGGWPQVNGDPLDYRKAITDAQRKEILKDRAKLDANIDDRTTTREINYLVKAYRRTRNEDYLRSAERGISYLLEAQTTTGGWPQYYPDTSRYLKHITFNDNAMINVMWVMKGVANREGDFKFVNTDFTKKAKAAMERGIDCILKCQIVSPDGTLTAWCAQYDRKTLLPAKARNYELPSISGMESVNIVRFLMAIPNPSDSVVKSISAAVNWFESAKLPGIALKHSRGIDKKSSDVEVVTDSSSTLWARFYDLETNRPFFTGRDGVRRARFAEVEQERRTGYGYYGKWPQELLDKEYPEWEKKNSLKREQTKVKKSNNSRREKAKRPVQRQGKKTSPD